MIHPAFAMASASSPIRFTEVSFVIAAASGCGGVCVSCMCRQMWRPEVKVRNCSLGAVHLAF